MAEPKEDSFLDDIEEAAAQERERMDDDMSDEAVELDALRAERDALRDKFMRALADAENARKRPRIMADPSWRAICCRYMTI